MGHDDNVISEWVEDIWDTYDKNDDGNIDKREIRKFIDQTFAAVNADVPYTEYDLDDLYEIIDVTEDGMISRAEMRHFFRKLGKK